MTRRGEERSVAMAAMAGGGFIDEGGRRVFDAEWPGSLDCSTDTESINEVRSHGAQNIGIPCIRWGRPLGAHT